MSSSRREAGSESRLNQLSTNPPEMAVGIGSGTTEAGEAVLTPPRRASASARKTASKGGKGKRFGGKVGSRC